MKLEERLNAFVKLNQVLSKLSAFEQDEIITQAANNNRWFDTSNVEQALAGLIHLTEPVKMEAWLTA